MQNTPVRVFARPPEARKTICREKKLLKAGGGDGSPGRTRTSDPAINSRLLYQLSYWGSPRWRSVRHRPRRWRCVYQRLDPFAKPQEPFFSSSRHFFERYVENLSCFIGLDEEFNWKNKAFPREICENVAPENHCAAGNMELAAGLSGLPAFLSRSRRLLVSARLSG